MVGPGGAWLRLDPTPSDDSSESNSWTGRARDWLDYVDTIWGDYVVSLSQQRQEQALYGAFRGGDRPVAAGLTWQAWRESFRTLAGWCV